MDNLVMINAWHVKSTSSLVSLVANLPISWTVSTQLTGWLTNQLVGKSLSTHVHVTISYLINLCTSHPASQSIRLPFTVRCPKVTHLVLRSVINQPFSTSVCHSVIQQDSQSVSKSVKCPSFRANYPLTKPLQAAIQTGTISV